MVLCISIGSVSAIDVSDIDNDSTNLENLNSIAIEDNTAIDDLNIESNAEDDYREINETESSDIIVNNVDSNYNSNNVIALGASLSESSSLELSSSSITLDMILDAATRFNNFVLENHGLPNTINVNGKNYGPEDFLYLMVSAIVDINDGKTTKSYTAKSISGPCDERNSDWISSLTITKANYVDLANRVRNFILTNNTLIAPNYGTLSDGKKADYAVYTAAFAGILAYYSNNKVLPSSYTFTNTLFESYDISDNLYKKKNGALTFYLTSDNIQTSTSDNNALKSIKAALEALGYKAVIVGVGPDYHYHAFEKGCTDSNSVLLCCFGGVDVGCIEEWTGELGKSFVNNYKNANILSVFYNQPYGASANVNNYVEHAWDANYGWALNDPAQYMEQHGISYIQTGTVNQVISILTSVFTGTDDFPPEPPAKYVTVAQVVSAAASLKSSIYYYGVLPSTVTVGSYKVSTAQFDYLMSVAIKYLKAGKKTSTKIKIVDASVSNPSYSINYNVKKSTYVSIATKIINYYNSHNKKLPNYVSVSGKKLSYRAYTYSFAKILAYYKSYKKLPSTCLLDSRVYNTRYVTVASILKASKTVSKYISSNKKLPSYVTMGSYRVKMPQFTYLMSQAIKLLYSKKKTSTKVKIIKSVSAPATVDSVKYTASKATYVSMAKKVSSYVSSNNAVPSYVTINSNQLSYNEYLYGFARALSYYYSHKKLPTSVSFYGF
ncbi:MAG: pseudomurein-binding repeat-containing protein [Methanobacteriaceae archaeon]|nr:pseudomurein-binding repeat-containing protein [Methanobacteriaceae archaeon]